MISVIVPVYNTEKYLPACIQSICQQTHSDLEIILVDDGSTDRSGKICDEFAQKDNRIIVIHKENGGHTSARNAGLRMAHGEYIGFVDSDDWIEESMYADLLSACEQENADVVVSAYCYEMDKKTRPMPLPIPGGLYQTKDGSMDKLLRNLVYAEDYNGSGIEGYLWNKLFKKDLLCKHQFAVDPRIRHSEDAVCVFSYLIGVGRIMVINHPYYHYRVRENSICNSTDKKFFEEITFMYLQLKASFSIHPSANVLMEQLKRYMLSWVLFGINQTFGFHFGTVVQTLILPYDLPHRKGLQRIVLYGAGKVGQRYYGWYQETGMAEVVAWVDQQWKTYQEKGFPTQPVSVLENLEFDGILITVSNANLAEEIADTLKELAIPVEKIFYEPPKTLFQTLHEQKMEDL